MFTVRKKQMLPFVLLLFETPSLKDSLGFGGFGGRSEEEALGYIRLPPRGSLEGRSDQGTFSSARLRQLVTDIIFLCRKRGQRTTHTHTYTSSQWITKP